MAFRAKHVGNRFLENNVNQLQTILYIIITQNGQFKFSLLRETSKSHIGKGNSTDKHNLQNREFNNKVTKLHFVELLYLALQLIVRIQNGSDDVTHWILDVESN